ncbi:MAG: hypothetical protein CVV42_02900 [Candidatus Riflebacteria bacterium HGW-Riflebacteria-2]|jgi:hypothetical protein|nr:MAG: hypothetical protein CVV42_02900 [Candidatus Riflebacteria bacterium HGW-Riflebacteria-2]
MKNRSIFVVVAIIVSLAGSVALYAQDDATKKETPPWLEGINMPPHPENLSPVMPLKIFMENGEAIPATLTEDIPITLVADTAIFDAEPPAQYNGSDIPNAKWSRNAAVSWFFIDWEKNKNVPASSTQQLALNQMVVTPINPTGKGAITCHIGRKMRYTDPVTGKTRGTFANASVGHDARVLDITPPTCGLEILVEGGRSGTFWVAENPPNKYPLPKLADVYFSGALINEADPGAILAVQGLELGAGMVVPPEKAAVKVPAGSVLKIKVNGEDNYKLDNTKLKYGICSNASGEPVPVSAINATEIALAELELPENPHFYVDASDVSGNRQVLYVPLKIK